MTDFTAIHTAESAAIQTVGRWLLQSRYRFTTVTPASHARVLARKGRAVAAGLEDVFGWSRPFEASLLSPRMFTVLHDHGLLEQQGSLWRSRLRFSTLHDALYAHSAYPTVAPDSVFFGPDTYRFCALIAAELDRQPLPAGARVLDVGCGAGPGGLVAAQRAAQGNAGELVLSDINPRALSHAGANAALAGQHNVSLVLSDLFQSVGGRFDLIVSNPPYLVDAGARRYRHGGGPLGSALSERIVGEGLERLAPGGRLVLYTGSAIVGGHDPFFAALQPLLAQQGWPWRYRELDPDVFGEELEQAVYAEADRIAAVAVVVSRPPL